MADESETTYADADTEDDGDFDSMAEGIGQWDLPRTEQVADPATGEVRTVVYCPRDRDFDEAGSDFIESPYLAELAEELMRIYPEIEWLSRWRLRYMWKRAGGVKGGNAILGKCLVTPPIARHFAHADWFIYISADHCLRRMDEQQMRALLFHELLHPKLNGRDEKPGTRGHDFEAFFSEIREFGSWKENLARAQRVFGNQVPLPEVP